MKHDLDQGYFEKAETTVGKRGLLTCIHVLTKTSLVVTCMNGIKM